MLQVAEDTGSLKRHWLIPFFFFESIYVRLGVQNPM